MKFFYKLAYRPPR